MLFHLNPLRHGIPSLSALIALLPQETTIRKPIQTIETVNESAQERIKTLDLFAQGKPTK